MKAEGIPFGVIYDGGGTGREENDQLWTEEAIQRFRAVESNPALVPDHAVLETWARWPQHMLPETKPGTMTNLVSQYVRRAGRPALR